MPCTNSNSNPTGKTIPFQHCWEASDCCFYGFLNNLNQKAENSKVSLEIVVTKRADIKYWLLLVVTARHTGIRNVFIVWKNDSCFFRFGIKMCSSVLSMGSRNRNRTKILSTSTVCFLLSSHFSELSADEKKTPRCQISYRVRKKKWIEILIRVDYSWWLP